MQEAKEEHPHLADFLEERLPQLGLDSETYGVYVVGVAAASSTTITATSTANHHEIDEPMAELVEIMDLLKASTEDENLAEDASIWNELVKNIQSQMRLDQQWRIQQHEQHRDNQKAEMQALLEKAKLEQEQAAAKPTATSKTSQVDDATKKAMLARFAYEDDDPAGGGEGEDGGEDEVGENTVNMNKLAAAQASVEKRNELKTKKVQTKSEEQQKTKEMRANKQQLKEERRKRAQKGERKR